MPVPMASVLAAPGALKMEVRMSSTQATVMPLNPHSLTRLLNFRLGRNTSRSIIKI